MTKPWTIALNALIVAFTVTDIGPVPQWPQLTICGVPEGFASTVHVSVLDALAFVTKLGARPRIRSKVMLRIDIFKSFLTFKFPSVQFRFWLRPFSQNLGRKPWSIFNELPRDDGRT